MGARGATRARGASNLALIVVRHGVSLLSHDFYRFDNTHSSIMLVVSSMDGIDRSLAPRKLPFARLLYI